MNNEKKMMLAIAVYAAVMTLVFNFRVDAQVNDAVAVNDKALIPTVVDEEVEDFLIKSADIRMMNAQGGLLASEKGTTSAIRLYGQQMMKDQSMLLEKLKRLAAARNINLPQEMSQRKVEHHQDMLEENGRDFDEKFIKIMTTDIERDIKLFRKACVSKDEEVSAFAQHYLPLIQSHLKKINEIRGKE
jgi:putative membrane protein